MTYVDEYAAERRPATLLYESPELPRSEHVLRLAVSDRINPESKYYWCTVDFAEVDA